MYIDLPGEGEGAIAEIGWRGGEVDEPPRVA